MAMTRAILCACAGATIVAGMITVWAWGTTAAEPGMSVGAKPSKSAPLSHGHYVDASKTVYWNTTMVQQAYEGDSVWYRLSLVNYASPGLRFGLKTVSPLLEVQVTEAEGKVTRHTVKLEKVAVLAFVRTPALGESMLDVVFDLHAVTGGLRPGKHGVVVTVPKRAYEVKASEKWNAGDLKSPMINVEVVELDKTKAEGAAAAWPIWIDASIDVQGDMLKGDLKNTTDEDVLIPVTKGKGGLPASRSWSVRL